MKLINPNEEWYHNRQVNLDFLAKDIEDWLTSKKYQTQKSKAPDRNVWLIQAKKKSFLRSVVASNRCFTIIIEGEPNEFYFKTGVSEWISNLPIIGVLSILSCGTFAIAVGAAALWTKKLQHDIKDYIRERIIFGEKNNDGEFEGDIYLPPTEAIIRSFEKENKNKLSALESALKVGAIDQKTFNNLKAGLIADLEISKRLIALKEAKDKGVITVDEYENKKAKLIKEVEPI
jgi:hypothetical protein